eukprot:scaffold46492_cov168-Amphora_coffeaeformis.AAC.5
MILLSTATWRMKYHKETDPVERANLLSNNRAMPSSADSSFQSTCRSRSLSDPLTSKDPPPRANALTEYDPVGSASHNVPSLDASKAT